MSLSRWRRKKGVEIVCSLGYDAYVKGNATLLASIFRNLIDNALAYSGCSRIDIRQESADSGYITISVADDGCGVASSICHGFSSGSTESTRDDRGRRAAQDSDSP